MLLLIVILCASLFFFANTNPLSRESSIWFGIIVLGEIIVSELNNSLCYLKNFWEHGLFPLAGYPSSKTISPRI